MQHNYGDLRDMLGGELVLGVHCPARRVRMFSWLLLSGGCGDGLFWNGVLVHSMWCGRRLCGCRRCAGLLQLLARLFFHVVDVEWMQWYNRDLRDVFCREIVRWRRCPTRRVCVCIWLFFARWRDVDVLWNGGLVRSLWCWECLCGCRRLTRLLQLYCRICFDLHHVGWLQYNDGDVPGVRTWELLRGDHGPARRMRRRLLLPPRVFEWNRPCVSAWLVLLRRVCRSRCLPFRPVRRDDAAVWACVHWCVPGGILLRERFNECDGCALRRRAVWWRPRPGGRGVLRAMPARTFLPAAGHSCSLCVRPGQLLWPPFWSGRLQRLCAGPVQQRYWGVRPCRLRTMRGGALRGGLWRRVVRRLPLAAAHGWLRGVHPAAGACRFQHRPVGARVRRAGWR